MVGGRRLELVAVIGTICAFSFIAGFIYPVIALALEARGFDEAAIGINATASGLGVTIGGMMVPRIVRRFGTFPLLAGCILLSVLVLILFPSITSYPAWLVLRFLLGAVTTGLFAAGESWINAIAEERTRGRTIALYVAAMSSSFAVGALLVQVTGYEGYTPFLVACFFVIVTFLPVLPFHNHNPLADHEPNAAGADSVLFLVMRQAAILLMVVFLFGVLDGVILGLTPSYSLEKGLSDIDAANPLAAMAIGVVLLQLPLGYLIDLVPRMRLLAMNMFVIVLLAYCIPMVDLTHWTGMAYMAVFGGISFAPYTIALSVLGERYQGQRLAAGSALFAIMWGSGSMVGPASFGVAMERYGADALPYGLAIVFLVAGFVALADRRSVNVRRGAAGGEDRTH